MNSEYKTFKSGSCGILKEHIVGDSDGIDVDGSKCVTIYLASGLGSVTLRGNDAKKYREWMPQSMPHPSYNLSWGIAGLTRVYTDGGAKVKQEALYGAST
jgi:hypothetical protein